MAGYGHGSATGIDERTLGRIDLLLFDADYPDAQAAMEDAWRIALLAAEPRLRDARERVRAEAVRAANERRDPDIAPIPHVGLIHRVALGAALVLAVVAAGLVLTSARPPLTLDITMLPAGLAAAASAALLWWLEPRRANGSLWASRAPSVLHLVCGCLWLFAGAVAVLGRWGEVDGAHPLAATTGLTLLGVSGAAALLLWWRARAADQSGRQSGTARLTGDLIDARHRRSALRARRLVAGDRPERPRTQRRAGAARAPRGARTAAARGHHRRT